MNITFSQFFKNFKKFINNDIKVKNRINSDSELLNYLFRPVIFSKKIKNKNGELLDLDKSRTSRILNNKDNVPNLISDEYSFMKSNIDIKKDYILMFKACVCDEQIDDLLSLLNIDGLDKYEALYDCFVDSLVVNNIKSKDHSIVIWQKGCNSIRITYGDIFEHCFKVGSDKKIIVVPVNTNFDVHVSTKSENIKPLVSVQTLHGKWLQRCKNAKIKEEDMQEEIQRILDVQCCNRIQNGEYPIGTVVPFDTARGVTYLLAISKFDKNNVAHSKLEDIKIAVQNLIEFYDYNGQGYPLYIPLIGTGRSRANLSYQQSYDLIKETLLDNKEHIQGTVNIIALPEVFEKKGIEVK